MTILQTQIIKEYEKTRITHPSYGEIAKKVGTPKSYVFKTIKAYKAKKGK